MGELDDGERAKVLGLNAARLFRFPIPERYLGHDGRRRGRPPEPALTGAFAVEL